MIRTIRPANPLPEPVELLTSQRVEFADTLDAFRLFLKAQLTSVDPLDLQLVVDLIPKTGIERAGKPFARPQPKAYLHLRPENVTEAGKLVILSLATLLILQNRGTPCPRTELDTQAEAAFKVLRGAAADAAYYALHTIRRAAQ